MAMTMKVGKSPREEIALTNRLAVRDMIANHVRVINGHASMAYTLIKDGAMADGEIGFNAVQRKFLQLALKQDVTVQPLSVNDMIGTLTVTIDFLKKQTGSHTYDSNIMQQQFIDTFANSVFSFGQNFVFKHTPASGSAVTFDCSIKNMDIVDAKTLSAKGQGQIGLCFSQTTLVFDVKTDSNLVLSGSAKGKAANRGLINPDWDFSNMGIGGLDEEFQTMFRRAFASRVFPLDVIQRMGIKHVKGILLHGPPGTGKTLMARQIGQMLQGREPKIVNGPEILSKFVGESEANIRRLFEDAEKEQSERGDNSSLHIIIFDEIDAICKARGTVTSGTGVQDSIVNQLLSKIDGVNSLNNILLIGMTNRIDMLDEALLRPGRLELKIMIGLPNEEGRLQILRIHTGKLHESKMLGSVDLHELARRTKNFSGAEIAGLVRCAVSYATNRCVDVKTLTPKEEELKNLKVEMPDFEQALLEIIPAFGVSTEEFERCTTNGILHWSPSINEILKQGRLLIDLVRNSDKSNVVSVLLEGPVQSGKTALAATLAMESGFPLIKMISPENMVGYSDLSKLNKVNKVFEDAYKSQLSVIVIDDLERLLDYTPLGQRFSNAMLQALMILLKKQPKQGNKLLILCTTSNRRILDDMNVTEIFSKVMQVNNLKEGSQIMTVLRAIKEEDEKNSAETFTDEELNEIESCLRDSHIKIPVSGPAQDQTLISIGIKKVYLFAEMAKQSKDRSEDFVASVFDESRRNVF